MSEQEVFWVGRGPSAEQAAGLPTEDPAFEAALREACERAGCPVQRYVAAKGPFGSWLLELQRQAQTQRLIWNGKTSRLSVDVPNHAGAWDERAAETLEPADTGAIVAAMQRLLADPGGEN